MLTTLELCKRNQHLYEKMGYRGELSLSYLVNLVDKEFLVEIEALLYHNYTNLEEDLDMTLYLIRFIII